MNLDALDLEGGVGSLMAPEGGAVTPPARRLVQRNERAPVTGERLRGGLRGGLGRGLDGHGESVPLRLDHGEDVTASDLVAGPGVEFRDPTPN